ncbi:MAG: SH3 domain-containing protein [Phormidesmis sp. RL_2_1]|nr:SH3 domain-containing protein [Phormidesmis sp. RL_2_1]
MKNFLLGLSKFVLGLILAMLIVSLAGLSMARYFMTKNAERPDRPTYENDLPQTQTPTSPGNQNRTADEPETDAAGGETAVESEAEADEALPEGAYKAWVNQSVGLVVRAGPGTDYENIGGLAYEQSVTVLSEDSGWLKITFGGGEEGWIKGGNVDRE